VVDHRGFPQLRQETTVAAALSAAGYETAWMGKFLNGYPNVARREPEAIPAGFSRWYAGITGRNFNFVVDDQGALVKITGGGNDQTDVYAAESEEFIRDSVRTGAPFFLTIATLPPHGEPKRRGKYPNPRSSKRHEGAFDDERLPQPNSFNEADVSDKPLYVSGRPRVSTATKARLLDHHRSRLASLLDVDDLVAGVVAELDRVGELDDTYIFFTSDNGYLQGEHRLVGKSVLYEESARVPLILRGPGVAAGAVHHGLTANVDVTATIYDVTGVEPLVELDGLSLIPAGKRPRTALRRTLLLENLRSRGVEDGRYVYIEHDSDDALGADEYELYDLLTDPLELENLSVVGAPRVRADVLARRPALAGVRDRLARRLAQLRDCAGTEGARACSPAQPVKGAQSTPSRRNRRKTRR
jgi:arylsulfatase A-like enzyme